jgi:NMD protein affecting ribosome stability and mRNA decay
MINTKDLYQLCKKCVDDPKGNISIAHQVACCTCSNCPVYHIRPIWVTGISQLMMEYLDVSTDLLCERARPLAEPAPSHSGDDQTKSLLTEIKKLKIKLTLAEREP